MPKRGLRQEDTLYTKFEIRYADGRPIPEEAEYFVLRIDDDPHARQAMLTYADEVSWENPRFGAAIRKWIMHYEDAISAGKIPGPYSDDDDPVFLPEDGQTYGPLH